LKFLCQFSNSAQGILSRKSVLQCGALRSNRKILDFTCTSTASRTVPRKLEQTEEFGSFTTKLIIRGIQFQIFQSRASRHNQQQKKQLQHCHQQQQMAVAQLFIFQEWSYGNFFRIQHFIGEFCTKSFPRRASYHFKA